MHEGIIFGLKIYDFAATGFCKREYESILPCVMYGKLHYLYTKSRLC